MANKKGTLYVITCFEKSRDYLFSALDNAPKNIDILLSGRLSRCCLILMSALGWQIGLGLKWRRKEPVFRKKAKRKINVLCSLLRIAAKQGCIAFSHYDQATKLLSETLLYLDKWIESDKARRSKLPNPSL